MTGVSLPPNSDPSHFDLIQLSELVDHHVVDIRDSTRLQHLFKTVTPQIVIHMAAQALVRTSYEDAKETFDTNVGGTVNLLEAVRATPSVDVCIVVTSDKCYENRGGVWGYRETDPMGGHDPYSASKGAAEIVTSSYLRAFFSSDRPLGLATVRAGNVIGGGDWSRDRLIPDCVRALAAGKPIPLRNPESKRPWQHVLDPLSGYLMLAQRLLDDPKRYAGAWNFGPASGRLIPVRELGERFVARWGTGQLEVVAPKEADSRKEATVLNLCIDKAINDLDWIPMLSTTSAIDWSVDWYKTWLGGAGMRDLSTKQIREYMNLGSE